MKDNCFPNIIIEEKQHNTFGKISFTFRNKEKQSGV